MRVCGGEKSVGRYFQYFRPQVTEKAPSAFYGILAKDALKDYQIVLADFGSAIPIDPQLRVFGHSGTKESPPQISQLFLFLRRIAVRLESGSWADRVEVFGFRA